MSIHFHLNSHSCSVPCYRNLNLLAHAQMEELEIGSRCGGHGICFGDRIRISSGKDLLSPITKTEEKVFTQQEIEDGWRLACQAWPNLNEAEVAVFVPKEAQQV